MVTRGVSLLSCCFITAVTGVFPSGNGQTVRTGYVQTEQGEGKAAPAAARGPGGAQGTAAGGRGRAPGPARSSRRAATGSNLHVAHANLQKNRIWPLMLF